VSVKPHPGLTVAAVGEPRPDAAVKPAKDAVFEDSPDFVQSLARGLSIVRAFDREHPALTLSEVALRVGLARAAARRCLLTLQHLGYVGARGRSFFLLPRVLELGYSYLSSLDLTDLAQRPMEDLSRQTGQSCSMAVLDAHDIVYVVRVPARRIMSIALNVGARLPAFATSMGRVVLADLAAESLERWLGGLQPRAITVHTKATPSALRDELARVRQQGYALVAQELELGLLSIAVPVRGVNGRAIAGLNVSMPYTDSGRQVAVRTLLPALRTAQTAIERAIVSSGWMPPVDARG
jgi:IclR family pca regulon transcriptional regulator